MSELAIWAIIMGYLFVASGFALGIDDAQFFHNRTSSTPEEVERCKAILAAGGYTALDMARAGRQIFDRAARKVKIDETLEEK